MEINDYELRSPAELIEEVAGQVQLTDDTAYVVLVRDPSRTQVVRDVVELGCGSLVENEEQARSSLEEACGQWDTGHFHFPQDLKVVTVVARRGLCVWTPVEWTWSNAWRRVSTGLSGGDLITVTEHGWYDFMTKHADHLPALVEA